MPMAGSSGQAAASADRVRRLLALGRELSSVTVMLHSRVAEQLGLSTTDHKCLDLAMRADGPLTAGRIAELSGLSTGAVTGVIDRLERAGYVSRLRDPHDRRKVLVQVNEVDEKRFTRLLGDFVADQQRLAADYSDEQLAAIEDYLARTIENQRRHIARFDR
ncbi:MarR family transcriptional regulator [Gandjariella thermophila]|uniref:MarR family transcriptional regulator n=2 Tax=Gandjariella thermophila TaxID=1931992 RepID=A0A4D4J8A1_9PSEU|nr:MarR family transcriptional regulator [Gandjariella thermophila]